VTSALPEGAVLIVGTGLVGTSVGLALRAHGLAVHLADTDPDHLAAAVRLGAGTDADPADVGLVVVAVPPRALGTAVLAALARWPQAVVTDVGSVKGQPLSEVLASGADAGRYAGSHPMAGSERSGPHAASGTLFAGHPWALTPHEQATPRATDAVRALAELCGSFVVELTSEDHDAAVATVSHLPHLLASVAAAQLTAVTADQLALAGQGVRDVTRVAAGDPELWEQILTANAGPLRRVLTSVCRDLDRVVNELGTGDAALRTMLERGRRGTTLIPPKRGWQEADRASVHVHVPDRPGELARLFADAGESGVNVEDVRIDHAAGRLEGRVEVVVRREAADHLASWLGAAGWSVYR